MDGTTGKLVHVAAEVVLVGGVIFYFNNQVKSLKNEIKELKIKIEEMTDSNNKHLNNLYSLVDRLNRSVLTPIQEEKSQPNNSQTGIRRRKKVRFQSTDNESETSDKPQTKTSQGKVQAQSAPDEDDLDTELGDELKQLDDEYVSDNNDVENENEENVAPVSIEQSKGMNISGKQSRQLKKR